MNAGRSLNHVGGLPTLQAMSWGTRKKFLSWHYKTESRVLRPGKRLLVTAYG